MTIVLEIHLNKAKLILYIKDEHLLTVSWKYL